MVEASADSVRIGCLGEGHGGADERESPRHDPGGDEGADVAKASEHGDSSCKWRSPATRAKLGTRDPLKG